MHFLRSTLVDLKNGLPPRALARKLHARGIVFVHVPKCAGSSVERALRARFRLSRTTIDPEASFTAAQSELSDEAEQYEVLEHASEGRRNLLHYALNMDYRCINGHAPLGSKTIAAYSNYDFVTVLREPKERFLSHLRFNLTAASGHGRIKGTLDNFFNSPRAISMATLYTKYFSGSAIASTAPTQENISSAMENLSHLKIIGFADQLSSFEEKLSTLVGKPLRIGHHNITIQTPSNTLNLSAEQDQLINQLIQSDVEIYNWAKGTFAAT